MFAAVKDKLSPSAAAPPPPAARPVPASAADGGGSFLQQRGAGGIRLGDFLEHRALALGVGFEVLDASCLEAQPLTLARRAEWHWMFTATGFIVMCVPAVST